MNRSDLLLVGLGGAGGNLVNTILEEDARFQGLFINTSITDLKSLDNVSELAQNFLCISTRNGVGRNREIGKEFAEINGNTMVDMLSKYQQDTIYLVTSFGGGSGSSILSVLLDGIQSLKEDGEFDKTVNLIAILPDLKSPDKILDNAVATWNETVSSECVNSRIYINNDVYSDSIPNEKEREEAVNQNFAKLFDSIFDIPDKNGTRFDNGNLSNILRDKGCLYVYELSTTNGTNMDFVLKEADNKSVLAKMYKAENNTIINKDKTTSIKCGHIGMSFNDKSIDENYILKNYSNRKEVYIGNNEYTDLLLISGCLPPVDTIGMISLELEDRQKNAKLESDELNFDAFKVKVSNLESKKIITQSEQKTENKKNENVEEVHVEKVIKREKRLKKNLFKKS